MSLISYSWRADAIIFKEMRSVIIFQKQLHIYILTPSLPFVHIFFFPRLPFINYVCTQKLSPAILLKPISLERVGLRRAPQSARELQTNNMHLGLCIPNSDCRRLLAKKVHRLAEESYLPSLIMFVRHSAETALTWGWAFVPTCIYGKTACDRNTANREWREIHFPVGGRNKSTFTHVVGSNTAQGSVLVKLCFFHLFLMKKC